MACVYIFDFYMVLILIVGAGMTAGTCQFIHNIAILSRTGKNVTNDTSTKNHAEVFSTWEKQFIISEAFILCFRRQKNFIDDVTA